MEGPSSLGRRYFVTGIGLSAAVLSSCAAPVGKQPIDGGGDDLAPPPGKVDVTVEIIWSNKGGAPVENAKVFDHKTNILLGETDGQGLLSLVVENGTVLRLVEPNYGQQQALRLVQGELRPDQERRVARVGEGWTIN